MCPWLEKFELSRSLFLFTCLYWDSFQVFEQRQQQQQQQQVEVKTLKHYNRLSLSILFALLCFTFWHPKEASSALTLIEFKSSLRDPFLATTINHLFSSLSYVINSSWCAARHIISSAWEHWEPVSLDITWCKNLRKVSCLTKTLMTRKATIKSGILKPELCEFGLAFVRPTFKDTFETATSHLFQITKLANIVLHSRTT